MAKECSAYKGNLRDCTCTYDSCSRKGHCCECIAYHRGNGQLPGCLFPPEVEKTYDRSIAAFVRHYQKKG